jgi:cytochrome b
MTEAPCGARRVKVWDGSTRVVHVLIIVLFTLACWTHYTHLNALHVQVGCVFAGVLAFRLVWGFIGSETARFRQFIHSPKTVVGYTRRFFSGKRGNGHVGHNPLGGWSVALMLSLLFVLLATGLCSEDSDGLLSGPLAKWISFDAGRAAAHWHGTAYQFMLAIIGLHVTAVLFYALVLREPLISAMVSGYRRVPSKTPTPTTAPGWRAVALTLAALVISGLLLSLAGSG